MHKPIVANTMIAVLQQPSLVSTSTHECSQISPILSLDEFDKTDKVRRLTKIGRGIVRSVSFMRKSLSRTNSISSRLSSTLETGSNHSIESLESSSESKDDEQVFVDFSKPLRSCIKGTRQNNKKYVVRFQKRSKNNIYNIESYLEYAANLWYTPQEKALLASPQLGADEERTKAEKFIAVYISARRQVYPIEWFDMNSPSSSSSYTKMFTRSYQDIVEGRRCGLAGFEQYSAGVTKRRKVHIKSVVRMVCTAYRDFMKNNLNSDRENTGMPQSKIKRKDARSSSKTIEGIVRKYSRSLSECDRYWAMAMGNADHDAIIDIYHEPDRYDDIVTICRTPTDDMTIGTAATIPSRNSMSHTTPGSGCSVISDNEDDAEDVEEFY